MPSRALERDTVIGKAPTLMQLAELLHCAAGNGHFEGVEEVALWLVGQSEEASRMHRQLVQMALDIGAPGEARWFHQAAYSHDEFERLLNAEEDWTDAAEILDPSGSGGFRYDYLLNICEARLRRGEEPKELLEQIRHKLRNSVEKNGQI